MASRRPAAPRRLAGARTGRLALVLPRHWRTAGRGGLPGPHRLAARPWNAPGRPAGRQPGRLAPGGGRAGPRAAARSGAGLSGRVLDRRQPGRRACLCQSRCGGLAAFSPAFLSNSAYDWLAPLIAWARPWLREPDGIRPMQNAVRYMTVPTNGFAQFYRSSRRARQALASGPYGKPVLMVVAEHDSVLDTGYLAQGFSAQFPHPASRLIWYGSKRDGFDRDPRVLVRTDYLPELRISQFSHMGLLFAPGNALYGAAGRLRLCWNGQPDAARADCQRG